MFFSIITIHPLPGEDVKIIDILDSMRGLTAANPDCQGCCLAIESGERKAICYMERWGTRDALERHIRSSLYCRVLEAMELSRLPPEVEFFEGHGVGALDFIEQIRLDRVSIPLHGGAVPGPPCRVDS